MLKNSLLIVKDKNSYITSEVESLRVDAVIDGLIREFVVDPIFNINGV